MIEKRKNWTVLEGKRRTAVGGTKVEIVQIDSVARDDWCDLVDVGEMKSQLAGACSDFEQLSPYELLATPIFIEREFLKVTEGREEALIANHDATEVR